MTNKLLFTRGDIPLSCLELGTRATNVLTNMISLEDDIYPDHTAAGADFWERYDTERERIKNLVLAMPLERILRKTPADLLREPNMGLVTIDKIKDAIVSALNVEVQWNVDKNIQLGAATWRKP